MPTVLFLPFLFFFFFLFVFVSLLLSSLPLPYPVLTKYPPEWLSKKLMQE